MARHGGTLATLLVTMFLVGGCQALQQSGETPLFYGMGDHHRAVTTDSELAQKYFDQGFIWLFAFNHDEAIRSFTEATRLDPECAMAWWGIALANGPHINNPAMTRERSLDAWDALQKAVALKDSVSAKERALIEALTARYASPPPEDRAELDKAYADAMRQVWEQYRDDPDIGTMFAESLMDLRPWDLWSLDGEPRPETPEVLDTLEEVMTRAPNHPGAIHLYIHAIEASPNPERALAPADRLRDLVPASGHLVHMPSHIYVLTGRWQDASIANVKAVAADRRYRRISPKQGFYHVYMVHNHHMLAFASMMEGRVANALRAAREMIASVPPEFLRDSAPLIDPYMGILLDVYKRFGKWDAILNEPAPADNLPITMAMWRFSRGLAYAAKGEIAAAEQERAAFRSAVDAVPADALMAINPAHKILTIAAHMLDGEIELAKGNIDASVTALREGVKVEDSLLYMEPPEWIQPIRHTLGAVLLKAGRAEEAEQVYRDDLKDWPNNGWSLFGLSRALETQGKHEEASAFYRQYRTAWSRTVFDITTSCLCVTE